MNIKEWVLNSAVKAEMHLADFNPSPTRDAPSGLKTSFEKIMGFMQYAGLVIMIAALIGAGVSFALTHNREDASESLTKLIKPLIGTAIIFGAVGIVGFLGK